MYGLIIIPTELSQIKIQTVKPKPLIHTGELMGSIFEIKTLDKVWFYEGARGKIIDNKTFDESYCFLFDHHWWFCHKSRFIVDESEERLEKFKVMM